MCSRTAGQSSNKRLDPDPLVSKERRASLLKCHGSRLPLDFRITEGGEEEGWRVSVAENDISVNDQVCPRGVVYIKAISPVTAVTT